MSNIRRVIIVFFLIILIPIKCNASESELLMDSFIEYCSNIKQYRDLKRTRIKHNMIGVFEITAYCPCNYCCGKTDGKTASGTMATANHTIAADLNQFSFGDEVIISGNKYVIEDSGGAIHGNKIDMFFNSHSEALKYGRRWEKLYREYEEEYVLKEVPFYQWMMITGDLANDKSVTTINKEDDSIEWLNQAGDILACRNKKPSGEFSNYVDEGEYLEWERRQR